MPQACYHYLLRMTEQTSTAARKPAPLPQLDGVLVLNKPSGPTSARCLSALKRPGQRKIGHAGTLDPMASGVLLVLLVEVMFLYSATRSYYNGVQQTMYRRFSSITGQLKMYTGETSQKTAASRSVALRRMVEQFSDKDKYEFMLLDSYGGVIASSSGTDADGIVTQSDFEQAQDAVDGMGVALYLSLIHI